MKKKPKKNKQTKKHCQSTGNLTTWCRINFAEKSVALRGHLKSSHIADKRKNFHMALYPLPPSSNESVIDNGRNIWQLAMHIILVLPHNLPNNVVWLADGRFPEGPASIAKWTRRQNLEQTKKPTISTFFSFHARSKTGGRCRSTAWNWSECLSLTFLCLQLSKANRYLRWIDCSRMPATPIPSFFAWICFPFQDHTMTGLRFALICKGHSALGWGLCLFFFHCRSHNESGLNPLPSIWKFFRLSAMCELLRRPLTFRNGWLCFKLTQG